MRSHVPVPKWFVLRTPLLPIDQLLNDSGDTGTPETPPAAGAALDAPQQRLEGRRSFLKEQLLRDDLQEAIFLASRDATNALDALGRGEGISAALESVAYAYLSRACSRSTPFGLFGGYSLGTLASRTRLKLPPRHTHRRHTQLAAPTVTSIVLALERQWLPRLSYGANSSLYLRKAHWYYVEGIDAGEARRHDYVRVRASDALTAVIEAAQQPAPFEALVTVARTRVGADSCTEEEAAEFVTALVDNAILVSSLRPPTTGLLPLDYLIQELNAVPGTESERRVLQDIRGWLAALDRKGVGRGTAEYRAIDEAVIGLTNTSSPVAYHVDLMKRGGGLTLGANVVAAIDDAVQVLHEITPDMPDARLEAFANAFLERFGDAEVPLLDALDEDVGPGFGQKAVDDLGLAVSVEFPTAPRVEDIQGWTLRDQHLYDLVYRRSPEPTSALVLEATDVKALTVGTNPPLPNAYHVCFSLAAESERAVDEGQFRVFIRHRAGPSGARLVGRFAQRDRAMRTMIRQHIRAEEQLSPDRIFAEIVHLPDEHLGNIFNRPVFREFEIPFLGASGAPREHQISVAELTVTIVDGQVHLRCPRLGARVLPRLTTAHNYFQRRPGVYQFLCALQMQTCAQPVSWTWGALESHPFLPRVEYKNAVLSRARWRLSLGELSPFRRLVEPQVRYAAMDAWRQSRGMPRYVALAKGDNELLVDFADPLSIDCFLHFTRAERNHFIWEQYPPPDQMCVTDGAARYAHEMLLMYVRQEAITSPDEVETMTPRALGSTSARRAPAVRESAESFCYMPGSKWLYLKLYTGHYDTDQLMLAAVSDIVEPARALHLIDQWFFIRYWDPHPHLRLRLHLLCPAADVLALVLPWIDDLTANQAVTRCQIDTYLPEVHRYGGLHGLSLMHRVFEADSDAAASIVRAARDDGRPWVRAVATTLSVDRLLEAFGYTESDRLLTLRTLKADFARRVRIDRDVKRALGQLFRLERARVGAMLDGKRGEDEVTTLAMAALSARTTAMRTSVLELISMDSVGELDLPLAHLMTSLVHMNVNRLLPRPRAEHELVIYDLLERLLAERLSRFGAPAVRRRGARVAG